MLRLVQGVSINCTQNSHKQAHPIFSQLHPFLKPLLGHPPVENRTKQARPRHGARREGGERRKCCFCVVSAVRNSCLAGTKQLLVQPCAPLVQPWLGSSDSRYHVTHVHGPCTQHSDLFSPGPSLGPSESAAVQQPFWATTPHFHTTAEWSRSGHWQSAANQPFPGNPDETGT